MSAYLKDFADIPTYTDVGSQNQICRDVLPKGIVPGLMAGYNILDGPGRTGLASHTDWHQVFIVVNGQATLLRGDEQIPVQAPCVIHIPPNTEHDMLVADGEHVEYVFINKYLGI